MSAPKEWVLLKRPGLGVTVWAVESWDSFVGIRTSRGWPSKYVEIARSTNPEELTALGRILKEDEDVFVV